MIAVASVHQHPDGLADVGPVLFLGNAVLHLQKPVKPAVFVGLGERIVHLRRRRSAPGRENKGEQRVVAHLFDEAHRILKFLLRLAGEAHDDVAGQHQIGHDGAAVLHQGQVLGAVVVAVHGLQNPVVARLEGQMELLADLGVFGDGVKELVAGVAGMGGHEAQAEFAGDLSHRRHQIGKIHPQTQILAVGIDVLAQKGDLLVAGGDQLPALFQNVLRLTGALPSPDVGHDAVGAEIVAAVHDRHPGLEGVGAGDGDALGDGAGAVLHGKDPLAGLQNPQQQLREFPQVMGGKDAVHMGIGMSDPLGYRRLAHHAAAEEDLLAGMAALGVNQSAHIAEDPLLRVLPDGAGVQHDDVGALLRVGQAVARLHQHPADTLGVGLVLLAAVGVHKGLGNDAPVGPVFSDLAAEFRLTVQFLRGDHGGFCLQGRSLL